MRRPLGAEQRVKQKRQEVNEIRGHPKIKWAIVLKIGGRCKKSI